MRVLGHGESVIIRETTAENNNHYILMKDGLHHFRHQACLFLSQTDIIGSIQTGSVLNLS